MAQDLMDEVINDSLDRLSRADTSYVPPSTYMSCSADWDGVQKDDALITCHIGH